MASLRTGSVFEGAPGWLGALWVELCDLEDQLGRWLAAQEAGTAVRHAGRTWKLAVRGRWIELVQASREGGRETWSSRFAIGLEWVDHDEDLLQQEIDVLKGALASLGA